MLKLQHPYISVEHRRIRSYGGSQMQSGSRTMREVGCGVIAALDLLLYLCRFHPGCSGEFFAEAAEDGVIDSAEYDQLSRRLSRRFFPLIPKLGVNGLMLAAGLNAFFRRYGYPFRARWGIGSRRLFEEIEALLAQDLPVILSVGPNFPLFWKKDTLPFYVRHADAAPTSACTVRAHYVTVTGIDEKYLHISSWGRAYLIDRAEYASFIRNSSGSIVSNIVILNRIDKANNGKTQL